MRFTTQVLLLQVVCVFAVVALCTSLFTVLGVQQLRSEAESSALSIARTVASDPDVSAEVSRISAQPGTPARADLEGGPLELLAADVEARTDALFVVITDDQGMRLAHPDAARLGQQVSTSFAEAMAGRESVGWESGTLGESARAKVPIFAPDGATPVGEVSVGFAGASVFDEVPALLGGLALGAVAALAIGALMSFVLRRRLERLTLGLQPEELTALVQNQAAVLDGVGEGVLAYSPDGTITVANEAALRMLGVRDVVGTDLRDLAVPHALREAFSAPLGLTSPSATDGVDAAGAAASTPYALGERIVYIDTRRVERGTRNLGVVAVIRDRTDIARLSERLETVSTMTSALRVQRHEFANRLHVAAGLIDADRVPDARSYLDEVLAAPSAGAASDLDAVTEPFLRSLLEASAADAGERGVQLAVGADTLLVGTVIEPNDVASVMVNLIDNAVRAAVEAEGPCWVEVELLDDGDTLVITVSDSGGGVRHPELLFRRAGDADAAGPPAAAASEQAGLGAGAGSGRASGAPAPDAIHGRGIGLPLIRDIARRHGGDVWLADAGGFDSGAVFCARLPHVMGPRGPQPAAAEPHPTNPALAPAASSAKESR